MTVTSPNDIVLLALEARRAALAQAWLDNEDALEAALGNGADDAEVVRLRATEDDSAEEDEVEGAIIEQRATTAAGLAVKARLVERYALPRLVEAGETYAVAALRSLLADLAA